MHTHTKYQIRQMVEYRWGTWLTVCGSDPFSLSRGAWRIQSPPNGSSNISQSPQPAIHYVSTWILSRRYRNQSSNNQKQKPVCSETENRTCASKTESYLMFGAPRLYRRAVVVGLGIPDEGCGGKFSSAVMFNMPFTSKSHCVLRENQDKIKSKKAQPGVSPEPSLLETRECPNLPWLSSVPSSIWAPSYPSWNWGVWWFEWELSPRGLGVLILSLCLVALSGNLGVWPCWGNLGGVALLTLEAGFENLSLPLPHSCFPCFCLRLVMWPVSFLLWEPRFPTMVDSGPTAQMNSFICKFMGVSLQPQKSNRDGVLSGSFSHRMWEE